MAIKGFHGFAAAVVPRRWLPIPGNIPDSDGDNVLKATSSTHTWMSEIFRQIQLCRQLQRIYFWEIRNKSKNVIGGYLEKGAVLFIEELLKPWNTNVCCAHYYFFRAPPDVWQPLLPLWKASCSGWLFRGWLTISWNGICRPSPPVLTLERPNHCAAITCVAISGDSINLNGSIFENARKGTLKMP